MTDDLPESSRRMLETRRRIEREAPPPPPDPRAVALQLAAAGGRLRATLIPLEQLEVLAEVRRRQVEDNRDLTYWVVVESLDQVIVQALARAHLIELSRYNGGSLFARLTGLGARALWPFSPRQYELLERLWGHVWSAPLRDAPVGVTPPARADVWMDVGWCASAVELAATGWVELREIAHPSSGGAIPRPSRVVPEIRWTRQGLRRFAAHRYYVMGPTARLGLEPRITLEEMMPPGTEDLTDPRPLEAPPYSDPAAPAKVRQKLIAKLEAAGCDPGFLATRPTPELQAMIADLEAEESGGHLGPAVPSPDDPSWRPQVSSPAPAPAAPAQPEDAASAPAPAAAASEGEGVTLPSAAPEPVHPGVEAKTRRKDRGWTQKELAERSGIPASTLSRFERGKSDLSEAERRALDEAFEQPDAPPTTEATALTETAPLGPVELLIWDDDAAMWGSERLFDDVVDAKAWLASHGAEGRRYSFRLQEVVAVRLITQRVLEAA